MTRALVFLALIFFAAPAAAECQSGTFREFQKQVAYLKPAYSKAKPEAFAKAIKYVNENRKARGKPPVEADAFVSAIYMDGPMPKVGIAFVSGDCMVSGTIFAVEPALWIQIMISMGIKSDDFVSFVPGDPT